MTLAEFKEQSEAFKTLRHNVPGIEMIVLVDRVAEEAYLAGQFDILMELIQAMKEESE